MKRIIFSLMIAMMALTATAQNDVTKFLGIPVDGTKAEMIRKLKAKGFTSSPYDKDILTGEFNGYDVEIHVVTNNNKVYRIMVVDANYTDENAIRIRFNRLCQQFYNNDKYIFLNDNYHISDDENITLEIIGKNKRYEACFFQIIEDAKNVVKDELLPILENKYSPEELSAPSAELENELNKLIYAFLLDKSSKKSVWFMINDFLGKYRIIMYYDNKYNQANGEDL